MTVFTISCDLQLELGSSWKDSILHTATATPICFSNDLLHPDVTGRASILLTHQNWLWLQVSWINKCGWPIWCIHLFYQQLMLTGSCSYALDKTTTTDGDAGWRDGYLSICQTIRLSHVTSWPSKKIRYDGLTMVMGQFWSIEAIWNVVLNGPLPKVGPKQAIIKIKLLVMNILKALKSQPVFEAVKFTGGIIFEVLWPVDLVSVTVSERRLDCVEVNRLSCSWIAIDFLNTSVWVDTYYQNQSKF